MAARQSMTRKLNGAASAMSSWLCDKIESGLRARSMSSGKEWGGLTRRLGDQGEALPMEKLMRPEPMLKARLEAFECALAGLSRALARRRWSTKPAEGWSRCGGLGWSAVGRWCRGEAACRCSGASCATSVVFSSSDDAGDVAFDAVREVSINIETKGAKLSVFWVCWRLK